jgi:hypothetical protein
MNAEETKALQLYETSASGTEASQKALRVLLDSEDDPHKLLSHITHRLIAVPKNSTAEVKLTALFDTIIEVSRMKSNPPPKKEAKPVLMKAKPVLMTAVHSDAIHVYENATPGSPEELAALKILLGSGAHEALIGPIVGRLGELTGKARTDPSYIMRGERMALLSTLILDER